MNGTVISWWQRIRQFLGKKAPREGVFTPFNHRYNYPSRELRREVTLRVFLPPAYYAGRIRHFPVVLFNDGQDMEAVGLEHTLARLYAAGRIPELVVVGIHADDNRLQEYGTAGWPDYRLRGSRAGRYARFMRRELLPFLRRNYRIVGPYTIAGFSLGGLSAFDLAWQNPRSFSQVGVFSGSFWWRYRPFNPDDPDAHRIAHELVRRHRYRPGLRFWFQTGTCDETSDRNGNGIIDAIDDTLDLIGELEKIGYRRGRDIEYVELEGGEHNPQTWGEVLPQFLEWASRRISNNEYRIS